MSPAQRRRWIGFGIGALVLAAVVVGVGTKWAFGRYIESDAFRQLVGETTGRSWHAETKFAPFHLAGSDLYCEQVAAQGNGDAAFSSLEVRQLHARWSLRKLLDRVCQLEQVGIEEASVDLAGPRVPARTSARALPEPHVEPARERPSFWSGWAPNRVEIGSMNVRHGNLTWAGGRLQDVAMQATAEDQGGRPAAWRIDATGGVFEAPGWPALELQSAKLRYRAPTLFVQSSRFRQGAAGTLAVDGEVEFGKGADLHAVWEKMPLDAVLTPDWRQHVHGTLNGEAQVRAALPISGAPELTGTWSVSDGRLEALPILNDLATFTGSAQFRQVKLDRLSGKFHRIGDRLEVTQIIAESTGLARLEGSVTLAGESIDGRLQLGLPASLVQLLPGARGGVFAISREGYLWTDLRIAGTATHPSEDLTARLAQAAVGQVVDTATQAVDQLKGRAQEAVKGVLDLFLGK